MINREVYTATGDTLIVHDEGSGPLVLLVSGLGGTAEFWRVQRLHLSSVGFRVISFDQPGCGEAPAPAGPVTISSLAAMTGQVVAQVAQDVEFRAIIGHSTGGVIAQEYLCGNHGPTPETLVLSGTWSRVCPYMQSLFEFRLRSLGPDYDTDYNAYTELTWLLGVTPADVVRPRPRAVISSGPDRIRAATQAARMNALLAFDGDTMVSDIKTPALVIGAQDDRIVPAYHQQNLASRIPSGQLRLLPDGGHFFPQSRSMVFNETISNWLENS